MKVGLRVLLLSIASAFIYLKCVSTVYAINIDNEQYYDLDSYLEKIADPMHFLYGKEEIVKRANAATFFVPRRATGVVLTAEGISATAAHVITHLYIRETKDCSKLKVILNHQKLDGQFPKEEMAVCEEIYVLDTVRDIAIFKLKKINSDAPFDYAPAASKVDFENAFLIGHPNAIQYDKSSRVISDGPVVFLDLENEFLPHFLHLIDTQGGHSGSPVFNAQGQVIGIHFRGVPRYSDGVMAQIDGKEVKIKRFNVASSLFHLTKWYPDLIHLINFQ